MVGTPHRLTKQLVVSDAGTLAAKGNALVPTGRVGCAFGVANACIHFRSSFPAS